MRIKKKISTRGLLFDPRPNSQEKIKKKCTADCKENLCQNIGSKRVKWT